MKIRIRTLVLFMPVLLLPSMAFADFSFVTGGSYPAGTEPAGIAIADLNQDGRLDVLAANDSVSTVSALLSTAGHAFASPAAYTTAFQGRFFHHSQAMASGDFNADGHLDFAATSQYGGPFYVSISLGRGDGTFLSQLVFQTGTCPTSVAVVDFNHDGKLDMVIANSEGSDISVLLGNGDGTFLPKVNRALPANPTSIIAADFNGDGNADVGVVGSNGYLWVFTGLGNGQLSPVASYPIATNSRALVAADFNRDGILDMAIANGMRGSISVLRGFGDGSFAPAVEYLTSDAGLFYGEANSIVAADLNNDGNLDLAVADFLGDAIVLFSGNRNGIFDSAQVIVTTDSPSTIGAADFDGNGSIDLAMLHYNPGTVSVLLNDVVFDGSFD